MNILHKVWTLVKLFFSFWISGIVGGIEAKILFQFEEFFRSLLTLEPDPLGLKYVVALIVVAIPILSLYFEYQYKKEKIHDLIEEISD